MIFLVGLILGLTGGFFLGYVARDGEISELRNRVVMLLGAIASAQREAERARWPANRETLN